MRRQCGDSAGGHRLRRLGCGRQGRGIKRLTERLDPRGYIVHPIAAPNGRGQDPPLPLSFLAPAAGTGQIAIFDRSWYGAGDGRAGRRAFAAEAEWKRAYREINQFERQLVDFGTIVFKFWMHISNEEQLRRFQERGARPTRPGS